MKQSDLRIKEDRKQNKIGIQWKMYVYFTVFIAAIILLLWLFQIVFLNDFYKAIKVSEVKRSAESISNNIDNQNLEQLITSIAQDEQIAIIILDSKGEIYYNIDFSHDSLIKKMSLEELQSLYQKAVEANGNYLEPFFRNDLLIQQYDPERFIGPVSGYDMVIKESILYAKLTELSDGTELVIVLNSDITPLNSTVSTLRVQLIWITVILLIIAFILTIFISKKISNPIKIINNSAKALAKGKYDVVFDGSGYKEISELSETLNYAARELSKVEKLRRELIANISHDLRTPLTMITGYSEILRDLPDENTPENIQIIIDEANRLTALVNDLLDLSKLQSGMDSLNLSESNVSIMIKNTLERYQKLIEKEGYYITNIYEKEVIVYADQLKISQVLYNLINNAINYTGEDRVITIKQTIKGDIIRIEVTDTGEGIAKEEIAHIWERYYKTDTDHKRAVVGTGLGLSIVKNVLVAHSAEFGVESEEGKGSTFWFELPIRKIV